MNTQPVTMVRLYLTEGEHQHQQVMAYLHDEAKVAGVTAFRGISGFGQSGRIHASTLLDMSLDLPLIMEFFDHPARVEPVLKHLNTIIKPGHIVSWSATINTGE